MNTNVTTSTNNIMYVLWEKNNHSMGTFVPMLRVIKLINQDHNIMYLLWEKINHSMAYKKCTLFSRTECTTRFEKFNKTFDLCVSFWFRVQRYCFFLIWLQIWLRHIVYYNKWIIIYRCFKKISITQLYKNYIFLI